MNVLGTTKHSLCSCIDTWGEGGGGGGEAGLHCIVKTTSLLRPCKTVTFQPGGLSSLITVIHIQSYIAVLTAMRIPFNFSCDDDGS